MKTTTISDLKNVSEVKAFIHDTFQEMMQELVIQETNLINVYYHNRTIPFDLYNLSIREIHAKLQCKREVYQRLTGEELE